MKRRGGKWIGDGFAKELLGVESKRNEKEKHGKARRRKLHANLLWNCEAESIKEMKRKSGERIGDGIARRGVDLRRSCDAGRINEMKRKSVEKKRKRME